MNDLSSFRPFSLRAFNRSLTPGIYQAAQLIIACQVKHLGFVEARPSSKGAVALAEWLLAKGDWIDRPKAGSHPLNCGASIERILAGEVIPDEEFALSLAEATEGAVLPEMFGHAPTETGSSAEVYALSAAGEKVPEPGPPPPDFPASAPSTAGLPVLGALGGDLPPGALFYAISDARFSQGFVLTGCGIMLCLDESAAQAMIVALRQGIDHMAAARAPRRAAA